MSNIYNYTSKHQKNTDNIPEIIEFVPPYVELAEGEQCKSLILPVTYNYQTDYSQIDYTMYMSGCENGQYTTFICNDSTQSTLYNENYNTITIDNPAYVIFYFKYEQVFNTFMFREGTVGMTNFEILTRNNDSEEWTSQYSENNRTAPKNNDLQYVDLGKNITCKQIKILITKALQDWTAVSIYNMNFLGISSDRLPYYLLKTRPILTNKGLSIEVKDVADIDNFNCIDPRFPVTMKVGSYIIFKFQNKVSVSRYSIRNSYNEWANQLPTGWKLYGSNEANSNWVEIDSRTNVNFKNIYQYNYNLDQTAIYRFFKFEVTECSGAQCSLWYLQLHRFIDKESVIEYVNPSSDDSHKNQSIFSSFLSTIQSTNSNSSTVNINQLSSSMYGTPKVFHTYCILPNGSYQSVSSALMNPTNSQNVTFIDYDSNSTSNYTKYLVISTNWSEILEGVYIKVPYSIKSNYADYVPSKINIGYRNFDTEEWQEKIYEISWNINELEGIIYLEQKLKYRQYRFSFANNVKGQGGNGNLYIQCILPITTSIFLLPFSNPGISTVKEGDYYVLYLPNVIIKSKNQSLVTQSWGNNVIIHNTLSKEEKEVEFIFNENEYVVGIDWGTFSLYSPTKFRVFAKLESVEEWTLIHDNSYYTRLEDGNSYKYPEAITENQRENSHLDSIRFVYFEKPVFVRYIKLEIINNFQNVYCQNINFIRWHHDYLFNGDLANTINNQQITQNPIVPPLNRNSTYAVSQPQTYNYMFDWFQSKSAIEPETLVKSDGYQLFNWENLGGIQINLMNDSSQYYYYDMYFEQNQICFGYYYKPYQSSSYYCLKEWELLVSEDKIDWVRIDYRNLEESTWTPDLVYYSLETPVTGKYFRIKLLNSFNGYASITTFCLTGYPTALLGNDTTDITINRNVYLSDNALTTLYSTTGLVSWFKDYYWIDYSNFDALEGNYPIQLSFTLVKGNLAFIRIYQTDDYITKPDENAILVYSHSFTNAELVDNRAYIDLYNITKGRILFAVYGTNNSSSYNGDVWITNVQLLRNDFKNPITIEPPTLQEDPAKDLPAATTNMKAIVTPLLQRLGAQIAQEQPELYTHLYDWKHSSCAGYNEAFVTGKEGNPSYIGVNAFKYYPSSGISEPNWNLNTWYMNSTDVGTENAYVELSFTKTQSVLKYGLYNHNQRLPIHFKITYSIDGIIWKTAIEKVDVTYKSELNVFEFPSQIDAKYFRFYNLTDDNNNSYYVQTFQWVLFGKPTELLQPNMTQNSYNEGNLLSDYTFTGYNNRLMIAVNYHWVQFGDRINEDNYPIEMVFRLADSDLTQVFMEVWQTSTDATYPDDNCVLVYRNYVNVENNLCKIPLYNINTKRIIFKPYTYPVTCNLLNFRTQDKLNPVIVPEPTIINVPKDNYTATDSILTQPLFRMYKKHNNSLAIIQNPDNFAHVMDWNGSRCYDSSTYGKSGNYAAFNATQWFYNGDITYGKTSDSETYVDESKYLQYNSTGNTDWEAPNSVYFDLIYPRSQTVSAYRVYYGTSSNAEYWTMDWDLLGSNTGNEDDWTVIQEIRNAGLIRGAYKTFTLDNPITYKRFRINIRKPSDSNSPVNSPIKLLNSFLLIGKPTDLLTFCMSGDIVEYTANEGTTMSDYGLTDLNKTVVSEQYYWINLGWRADDGNLPVEMTLRCNTGVSATINVWECNAEQTEPDAGCTLLVDNATLVEGLNTLSFGRKSNYKRFIIQFVGNATINTINLHTVSVT